MRRPSHRRPPPGLLLAGTRARPGMRVQGPRDGVQGPVPKPKRVLSRLARRRREARPKRGLEECSRGGVRLSEDQAEPSPSPPHPKLIWIEYSSAAENLPGPSAGRSVAARARRGSAPGALAVARRLPQSWRRGRPAARDPAASWRLAPEQGVEQMEHSRPSSAERSQTQESRELQS